MVQTLLLVDGLLDQEVENGNDDIASNVDSTHNVENVGIFEGDLLCDLHHPEDDDKVDTVEVLVSIDNILGFCAT